MWQHYNGRVASPGPHGAHLGCFRHHFFFSFCKIIIFHVISFVAILIVILCIFFIHLLFFYRKRIDKKMHAT
jgi:hypothetical protein